MTFPVCYSILYASFYCHLEEVPLVKKWKVKIPALSGEKERRAYIYLPASYNQNPDRRYPVMYMFDGHNVFFDADATYGKSWGMNKYMQESKKQLIPKRLLWA